MVETPEYDDHLVAHQLELGDEDPPRRLRQRDQGHIEEQEEPSGQQLISDDD